MFMSHAYTEDHIVEQLAVELFTELAGARTISAFELEVREVARCWIPGIKVPQDT